MSRASVALLHLYAAHVRPYTQMDASWMNSNDSDDDTKPTSNHHTVASPNKQTPAAPKLVPAAAPSSKPHKSLDAAANGTLPAIYKKEPKVQRAVTPPPDNPANSELIQVLNQNTHYVKSLMETSKKNLGVVSKAYEEINKNFLETLRNSSNSFITTHNSGMEMLLKKQAEQNALILSLLGAPKAAKASAPAKKKPVLKRKASDDEHSSGEESEVSEPAHDMEETEQLVKDLEKENKKKKAETASKLKSKNDIIATAKKAKAGPVKRSVALPDASTFDF